MTEPESFDILIRGCTALTSDPAQPLIDDAAIGIRGNRLACIAKASDAEELQAKRVIDARGHVATPGFVNVHTHAVLSLARGMTDDAGLLDDGLIAAHCLVMTEDDIARAGRAHITVAHAPKVNMTGGYMPVTSQLRRAGAQI